MGENTLIQWAHHTFNPWRGCTRVSAGCDHCYAEAASKRNPAVLGEWGDDGTRVTASEAYWRKPIAWDRRAAAAGERHRVFCASLADVFEDRPELDGPRHRLFALINQTPNLDWLLLTKRPDVAVRMLHPDGDIANRIACRWPLPNVWVGTTVESMDVAGERISALIDIPAAIRFLSCEPLISPVDLDPFLWLIGASTAGPFQDFRGKRRYIPGSSGAGGATITHIPSRDISWVIVGGESGPHARPMNIAWAEQIVEQCQAAAVPVFVKQLGKRPVVLDVIGDAASPLDGITGKGGNPDEWPEHLRVREIPTDRKDAA